MRLFGLCLMLAMLSAAFESRADETSRDLKHSLRAWRHPLHAEFVRKGLIDYSVPRPYRYAVPITTLGPGNAKLMMTYTDVTPDRTGTKGVLLFAKIPLQ